MTSPVSPSILIIGAGFGGLAAALELEKHGFTEYTVLERADRVGGVWAANTYPGAACDVPSVIYQFSRYLNDDWSQRFGTQEEIAAYLNRIAVDSGVIERVRLNTKVLSAAYDEAACNWKVCIEGGETLVADVLIAAPGQLSNPNIPSIPGREGFAGPQFHSAQWDHSVNYHGKHVAVVGGGASAVQIVPAIAGVAGKVTLIQRSPMWIVNRWNWQPSSFEKKLVTRVPSLLRLYHLAIWWWFESRFPVTKRWSYPLRRAWMAERRSSIKRIVRDPKKIAALTPGYQMGCNRILLSRQFYPACARDDVDVIGGAVTEVDNGALITSTGEKVEPDIVVWCTGFTPTQYLAPIRILGRGGIDIRDAWAKGPEAYLGLATPGFPNLFMSYGPNTGSLTNTIIFLLERQAHYARQAVEYLAAHPGALEIKQQVHDEFNRELQERLAKTVFTTGCPGWYTTDEGKVTQVWVGSHVEYARRTNSFDPTAYELHLRRPPADVA